MHYLFILMFYILISYFLIYIMDTFCSSDNLPVIIF